MKERFAHAWAEIAVKIYVPEHELEERLMQKYPEAVTKAEQEEGVFYVDKCPLQQRDEAFSEIAKEKVDEMFSSSSSIKPYETVVDASSITLKI